MAGCGISTAGLVFGGGTNKTEVEEYDGTSWSVTTSLATGRGALGGSGVSSSALAFGGNTGSVTAATEEFTTAAATKTFTTS
jgi:hypothetical protein